MRFYHAAALSMAMLAATGYKINNPAGDIQVLGGGEVGPQGPPGPPGQGSPGPSGNTVLTVSDVPSPLLGKNGDYALNPATAMLYGPKQDGFWSSTAIQLRGPKGETGATTGNTVLNGTGAPGPMVGNNNDFYVDNEAHVIYGPKAAGQWPPSGFSLVGAPGPKGDTGAPGQSITGPMGPQGLRGLPGADSTVAGPKGEPGTSIYSGDGPPAAAIGTINDFYIDNTARLFYGPKTGGTWPSSGVPFVGAKGDTGAPGQSIVGATGPQGERGLQGAPSTVPGPKGDTGTSIYSGSGAPAPTVGNDNDYYIDSVARVFYGPKVAGSWPSSGVPFLGAKGDKGDPGDSVVGPPGPAGAPGAPGAASTVAGPAGSPGKNGTQIYSGIGAPSNALGNDNDFFISKDSTVLYGPKLSSAWPAGISLVGPAGPAGAGGVGGSPNSFPLLAPNTSPNQPVYSFTQSPNTGLGSNAGDSLYLSTNGVPALSISPSQVSTFSGPTSVANGGTNHLTLTTQGSTSGTPTIRTVGTYSAAANVNTHWQWLMNSINTNNGIESPVYRMSMRGADANASVKLAFDNVYTGFNIFTYDDAARTWAYGSTNVTTNKLGLPNTSSPGTLNTALTIGPASIVEPTSPIQVYTAPQYGQYIAFNNGSTGLGGRFGYNSYTSDGASLEGTTINASNGKPVLFNFGYATPSYGMAARAGGNITIGGGQATPNRLGVLGNVSIGSTGAATAAPVDGLRVQGDTVLNGNVLVMGSLNQSASASFPFAAPTGTTAAPNVPYSFANNATSGLAYNTTTNNLELRQGGTAALTVAGSTVGLGGYAPTSNVFAPLVINTPPGVGGTRYINFLNNGGSGTTLGYNNDPGGPLGMWIRGFGASDYMTFTTTNGVANAVNYALKINNNAGVAVGGNLIGPANGMVVQGNTWSKGGISVGAAGGTNARSVYTLESASAESGVDYGAQVVSHQMSATGSLATSYAHVDNGAAVGSFGYNKYTGDGVPVSLNMSSTAGIPLLFVNGPDYRQIGGSFYNAANTYKWHFGPLGAAGAQGASTVSVKGNATVGSGISGSTAAPADGLLVQGLAQFQNVGAFGGWAGDTTNQESALQVNAKANLSGTVGFYNQGAFGGYLGINNFNGGANFPVGMWLRSYTPNQSLYLTSSTTTGVVNYGLKVNPNGAVSVGSAAAAGSPLGVFGGVSIGSTAAATAAPVDGMRVQGDAVFQGNVTFLAGAKGAGASSGSLTGTTNTLDANNTGTTYFVTTTAGATLPAVAAGAYVEFSFVVTPAGAVTLTAPSGGTLTLENTTSAASGNATSTGPTSVTLVGIPGTSNWQNKNGISGAWNVN